MTKLEFFNKFLFQFLFIRLTRVMSKKQILSGYQTKEWYAFQYWIIPLTGWSKPFKYLNEKPKYLKVSKAFVYNENIL